MIDAPAASSIYRAGENTSFGGCWATIVGDTFYNPTNGGGGDVSVSIGEAQPRPGDGMRSYALATGEKIDVLANKYRVVFDGATRYAVGDGTLSASVDGNTRWSVKLPQRVYTLILAGNALIAGTNGRGDCLCDRRRSGTLARQGGQPGARFWRWRMDGSS